MSKIFIISGATSTGKSEIANDLAQQLQGKIAIINADSLQIYEGLPILSAQPTFEEQKLTPHFLYSYLKPHEKSSVALWLNLVKPIIEDLWRKNITPIIVGGTGMYLSKLVAGISKIPEISDEIKQEAQKFYDENGAEVLRQKLTDLGEKEILDKQRLIRAFEVFLQTKKTLSWWQNQPKEKIFENANFIHANLEINREKLYENCNFRFEKMLKSGAISEVENLRKILDKNQNYSITKTLGYEEICDYLDEKISEKTMIEIATKKTRNYAKRQLTWFRTQILDKKTFSDKNLLKEYILKNI